MTFCAQYLAVLHKSVTFADHKPFYRRAMNNHTNRFATTLLQWFEENARTLPWRGIGDAYAVWLSEVILQQTRIEQGTDYWYRFMETFPTVEQLAEASEDEVLRLWQGLGYYSRARHLHQAARQVVQMGGFPQTAREIVKLKGVGPYTAAAIASMAFGEDVAAVDGNVYRVLARHFGIDTPINSTQGQHTFHDLATSLLPAGKAGDFNQALMDFGAMVCTPHAPHCLDCPLADSCMAMASGQQSVLPVKLKTVKVKNLHFRCVYLRCQGYTAWCRRPSGGIWQGLWQPLLFEDDTRWQAFLNGLPQGQMPHLFRSGVKHVLTHRVIMADFYLLDVSTRSPLPEGYQWIAEHDLDNHALPRLFEIMVSECPRP